MCLYFDFEASFGLVQIWLETCLNQVKNIRTKKGSQILIYRINGQQNKNFIYGHLPYLISHFLDLLHIRKVLAPAERHCIEYRKNICTSQSLEFPISIISRLDWWRFAIFFMNWTKSFEGGTLILLSSHSWPKLSFHSLAKAFCRTDFALMRSSDIFR